MISFIEELHAWLAAQLPESALSVHQLPPDPPEAIALIPTGGLAVDRYLGVQQPTVQVLVRHPDGAAAYQIAEAVGRLLTNRSSIALGVHYVSFVQAMTYPLAVGTDANGSFLVSCNYLFRMRLA